MTDESVEVDDVLEAHDSWVWVDRVPTVAEMLDKLRSLPDTYGLSIVEYADFVLPLKQSQKLKIKDNDGKTVEKYVETWRMYMTVAGRVKMLNDAQALNQWVVRERQELLSTDPFVMQMEISIDGPTADERQMTNLGNRFGVSKTKGGDTAWEKMETAARGRAIAAWGLGVIAGSGIASLDEMQDVLNPQPASRAPEPDGRTRQQMLDDTKSAIEELRQSRDQDRTELWEKIQKYLKENLGVTVLIGEDGLDLAKLKDGQIALLEKNIRKQNSDEMRAKGAV